MNLMWISFELHKNIIKASMEECRQIRSNDTANAYKYENILHKPCMPINPDNHPLPQA